MGMSADNSEKKYYSTGQKNNNLNVLFACNYSWEFNVDWLISGLDLSPHHTRQNQEHCYKDHYSTHGDDEGCYTNAECQANTCGRK